MSEQLSIADAVAAGRRARRRGARGELQVIEILRAFGFLRARRNFEYPQFGRDILGGPEGTYISVKLTERLKLREAFAECSLHAQTNWEIPIVFHRSNKQPWLCTLPAEELLPLLAMRERG